MKTNDYEKLYDALKTAKKIAGAEHGKLYNADKYIDACVFQSIRDSITQNMKLLQSYRTYTTELQYRYKK